MINFDRRTQQNSNGRERFLFGGVIDVIGAVVLVALASRCTSELDPFQHQRKLGGVDLDVRRRASRFATRV
jgi:hypothetical protein